MASVNTHYASSLNPRFDGAFLNFNSIKAIMLDQKVLIPDLMGLF
jgi:hypothetical protein